MLTPLELAEWCFPCLQIPKDSLLLCRTHCLCLARISSSPFAVLLSVRLLLQKRDIYLRCTRHGHLFRYLFLHSLIYFVSPKDAFSYSFHFKMVWFVAASNAIYI
ncbi:hypothetical protein PAHAL_4G015300 [Panicum hallii]|uniref:Uncharacterized protein n=1 Tax=Panicum hallii TaxID=206008 RepID=A0A2T8JBF2_9POAL|nr:hypothetical protein PAHAL_4G015300 [Panicum hallii]